MSNNEMQELSDKLRRGLQLAEKRLLEKKPWQLLIINLMKNIYRQRIRHIIMTVLCGK